MPESEVVVDDHGQPDVIDSVGDGRRAPCELQPACHLARSKLLEGGKGQDPTEAPLIAEALGDRVSLVKVMGDSRNIIEGKERVAEIEAEIYPSLEGLPGRG